VDDTEQKTISKQICSMRIMFPVESDERAIAYKKKVNNVLADIPQARIEFSLSSVPNGVDLQRPNR